MIWNCQNVVEGLILFNVCMCTIREYDVITLVFSKEERRHKSYKMCIVDKRFIQLQFHEANILIVHFFGQLTKGIFYNLKILTLSCFRRHKDLKLLLNLLAETSGVSQLFFCNCVCWSKRRWWYIWGDIYVWSYLFRIISQFEYVLILSQCSAYICQLDARSARVISNSHPLWQKVSIPLETTG